jgi:hypothetical protein
VIADYRGEVGDPAELAAHLGRTGRGGHGLFPPAMVTAVVVGRGNEAGVARPGGRLPLKRARIGPDPDKAGGTVTPAKNRP